MSKHCNIGWMYHGNLNRLSIICIYYATARMCLLLIVRVSCYFFAGLVFGFFTPFFPLACATSLFTMKDFYILSWVFAYLSLEDHDLETFEVIEFGATSMGSHLLGPIGLRPLLDQSELSDFLSMNYRWCSRTGESGSWFPLRPWVLDQWGTIFSGWWPVWELREWDHQREPKMNTQSYSIVVDDVHNHAYLAVVFSEVDISNAARFDELLESLPISAYITHHSILYQI